MKIKTERKEILNGNFISVTAGTNCPHENSSNNHNCNSRTFIKIADMGRMDWSIEINHDAQSKFDNPETILIALEGDSACEAMLQALKFTVKTLENQIRQNRKKVISDALS